jgi:queuine tRNA-ribosyltransferase
VVLLGLWAGPHLLNWERYRGALAALASDRMGRPVTLDGPINIKNLIHANDPRPLCESAHPHVAGFSRAYLRHLFRAGEILGLRLLSFHNLHFYLSLVAGAREAITAGTFLDYQKSFVQRYTQSATQ